MLRQLEDRAAKAPQLGTRGDEGRNVGWLDRLTEALQLRVPFLSFQDTFQRIHPIFISPLRPGGVARNPEQITLPRPLLRIELSNRSGTHGIENHDKYFLGELFCSGD